MLTVKKSSAENTRWMYAACSTMLIMHTTVNCQVPHVRLYCHLSIIWSVVYCSSVDLHCLGVEFGARMVTIDGKQIKLQIWDTVSVIISCRLYCN